LQACPTKYCWPVRGPDCCRRGRLWIWLAVVSQAARSCSVSSALWLQYLTAPAKFARVRNWPGLRRSVGTTYRRRNCLPLRT
jgi:hypothetical protein